LTAPVPLPDAPLVIEIHDALSVALHPQPAVVVTEMVPALPAAATA
jgi:hypothetical protein